MSINDNYNKLTRNKSRQLNLSPEAFLPSPTEKEYKRGWIYRYFVQRANDESSPIYEISDTNYREFIVSPMFATADLKWRLTGPLTETKIGAGEVVDYGVEHSNKMAIKIASANIKKLGLYLPNLKQFYR